MNLHPARTRQRLGSLLLLVVYLCHPAVLLAPPPAWWAERGATNTNPPDDYAAANLGQLKQMAVKARDELNLRLPPNGAGRAIETMIAGWNQPNTTTRDDYAAVTLGQLKYVGKLFYDRLTAAGSTRPYPWAGSPNPADDPAIANLGQVKQVFSFDLTYTDDYGVVSADLDGNRLPDEWELLHGLSPADPLDAGSWITPEAARTAFEDGTDPLEGVEAADGGIGSPPAAPTLTGARTGQYFVRLAPSWVPGGTDKLAIFRARDGEGWVKIHEQTNAASYTDDAPAGTTYRYTAAVIGQRRIAAGFLEWVGSDPATEVVVADVPATVSVTAWWYPQIHPPAVPVGQWRIAGFIPEQAGGPLPETLPPWNWAGPLAARNEYGRTSTQLAGWLTRGVDIHFSADWQAGRTAEFGALDFVSAGVSAPGLHGNLAGADTITPTGRRWTLADTVGRVDWAVFFNGDETRGFDARSAPRWQMVPAGGARDLWLQTDAACALGASTAALQFTPGQVPAGYSSARVSADADTDGDKTVEAVGQRASVGVDVRPAKQLAVVVHRVFRLRADGTRMDVPPQVTKAALEAQLNAVYAWPANVFFTVTLGEDVEFTAADDLIADNRIDFANELAPFRARVPEGQFAVFLVAKGAWGQKEGTPPKWRPSRGGRAFKAARLSFVDDGLAHLPGYTIPSIIAHELGHCLGLFHAFSEDNAATGNGTIPDASASRVMGYGDGRRLLKAGGDRGQL